MNQQTNQTNTEPDRCWWKEAVIYQIYPRSFKDSNGDGIGDLQGIVSKLDYIHSLGIDVVWLNPVFCSPNDDNGYDISDYQNIMREFGTMADFDALLDGLHKRNIRLVLDLVVNHSSDEHTWFKESRSSRDNPYRDYYHWCPAEKGKPAPRFSFFDINNDAWAYDANTNAYYLHYFSEKQPDLKWENPQLRQEIYQMMKFWFDKGIDGFRMDVIPFISKDTSYPPLPDQYYGDYVRYYAEGPSLHRYLQEMNREVLSHYDVLTVAEGIGVNSATALNFVDPERKELNLLYHFEGVGLGLVPGEFKTASPDGFGLIEFKDLYSKWDAVYREKGWGTIYLANHDNPRMLSRWGNDQPEFREVASKMLSTFLLTMRATPFYYYGDEIGMYNIKFDQIEDYRDIETLNMYEQLKKNGGDLDRFLFNQKMMARDNGRTPFQWDDSDYAGFSDIQPWLNVNPDYKLVNAAAQENDPDSILNYFRKLVQLRKNHLSLVYGMYTLVDRENFSVYSYSRRLGDMVYFIALNFTTNDAYFNAEDFCLDKSILLLTNYPDASAELNKLRPYEARIFKLEDCE